MPDELTRALLVEEVVSPRAVGEALFLSLSRGVPLVRALIDTGAAPPEVLERYLSREGAPVIERVVPVKDLVERLPKGLCRRLLAVPVRRDAITGTVDVALANPTDTHAALEIGFHLRAPVRIVRASLAAIEELVEARRSQRPRSVAPSRSDTDERRQNIASDPPIPLLAPKRRATSHTPPWGTPVHNARRRVESDPPQSRPGSEIPLPLTRRTAQGVTGGTQKPPPIIDPSRGPLDEGIPFDEEQMIAAVEVGGENEPMVSPDIPGPPRVPRGRSEGPPPGPSLLETLRTARTRDVVLDCVLQLSHAIARRVALFVVKKGGYVGWSCTPEFGDRRLLEGTTVPLDSGSILDIAVRDGMYFGPVHRDVTHAGILGVLGTASPDVAVIPVRVSGKTAVIIMADDVGDAMVATGRLEELALQAGDALARIVRQRR